jgi:hypothetical protein
MTKPVSASDRGLKPHYKVRVVVSGSILHLACWTEPKVIRDNAHMPFFEVGKIATVEADWIKDGEYGDTLGYIDWEAVSAVSWRWCE